MEHTLEGYERWIEVDLNHLKHNIHMIRSQLKNSTQLMAVVKGNAFGHGADHIAKWAIQYGADCLGVALLSEGIELRRSGINAPIVVLGAFLPEEVEAVLRYDLIPSICSLKDIDAFSQSAEEIKKPVKVHIRIDTGMNGPGIKYDHAVEVIQQIHQNKYVQIEGIFTHIAASYGGNEELIKAQIQRFDVLLQQVNHLHIHIPIRHISNSYLLFYHQETHHEMVRAGIAVYGMPFSDQGKEACILKPIMQIKARVIFIGNVNEGEWVGYGEAYKTARATRVAVVPWGYADARFLASLQGGYVLIHGQRVPILGYVCMDQMMVDITDVENVQVGDEVILLGTQGSDEVTIQQMLQWCRISPLNGELITLVSERVPRIYKE